MARLRMRRMSGRDNCSIRTRNVSRANDSDAGESFDINARFSQRMPRALHGLGLYVALVTTLHAEFEVWRIRRHVSPRSSLSDADRKAGHTELTVAR
jgi:hypothetical protein